MKGECGCCIDRRLGGSKPCNESTCMELPTGVRCGGCSYFNWCRQLFGCAEASTLCDYFPRRYRSQKVEGT